MWDFQQCGMCDQQPQISLRICAVWSEPLLVAQIFYDCYATDRTSFGVSMLKRRLHWLVCVYTCQNATLLEISCHSSFLNIFSGLSKPLWLPWLLTCPTLIHFVTSLLGIPIAPATFHSYSPVQLWYTVKPRLFEVPGTAGILSNNR